MAKIPPHIVLKSPASITLKFRSPQLPRSFTTSEKGQHIVFQVTRVAASARRGRKCRAAAKSPPELVSVEGVRLRYRGGVFFILFLSLYTHAQVTEDSTSNYAASNSARLEQDGVVAEKENAVKSQSRTQRVNDTMQHSSQTAAMSANR